MATTQNIIGLLAQSMGVSETDVTAMVQGILNDLIKDGVDVVYVESSGDIQCDLVQAYALHQVKKCQAFHTTYLTNPHAASAFQNSVYDLINQS